MSKQSFYDYSVSWSLDEKNVYLDNETLDEREVWIQFVGDSKKAPKETKVTVLKEMIKILEPEKENQ